VSVATEEDNLPDWLRQLRDQQMGAAGAEPAEPAELPGLPEPAQPLEEQAPPAQAESSGDAFEDLRQRASVEPPPVEERPRLNIPVVNQLQPVQRFILALMLFLASVCWAACSDGGRENLVGALILQGKHSGDRVAVAPFCLRCNRI
jgi:hypothetical protein